MWIALPDHSRRAWRQAFWIALSLWTAVAVGALMPVELSVRMMAAVVVAAAAAVAGLVQPAAVTWVYHVWNRGARGYARVARAALLTLCYGVVAVAAAGGSSLKLRRPGPGESLWSSRSTLPSEAYSSLSDGPGRPRPGRHWTAILQWSVRSGNGWAIALVPFLVLIAALDTSERAESPTGIYTLF